MKKFLRISAASVTVFGLLVTPVLAADDTDLLPPAFRDLIQSLVGGNVVPYITGRVQLILILLLSAVVVAAVIFSILAAFKYISSQGDAGKIEEAQKSIKAIFMGIGAMLISIIGIVVIFTFFGVTPPPTDISILCGVSPGSVGCKTCTSDNDGSLCKLCEASYELNNKDFEAIDPQCK